MDQNDDEEYLQLWEDLIERATAAGITQEEFEKIYHECLEELENDRPRNKSRFNLLKVFLIVTSLIVFFYVVNFLLNGKPVSLFLCKLQEFIYPGLRLLRIISIPIISAFPSLTEYYDETCLIQNPFFRIDNMDCWPCYGIKKVSEISGIDEHFQPQTSPPFIYKTDQKYVTIDDLKQKYLQNKKIFDENASKVNVNNRSVKSAQEFFNGYNTTKEDVHRWRINRMLPALVMRTLFPRPAIIPRLGQSPERFLMIDNPNSMSYELPEPECNYVFIIQSAGERFVEFQPANECLHHCSSVSVLLPESYLLWYNWWYWRPISHSTNSNSTSISYVGSYC